MAMASIFLCTMAQPGLATISRVGSLGGCGDYFEDDSNVLHWYGSLADYPDQVVLESGNFNIPDGYWQAAGWKRSGPGFGAHMALGQEGRLGTAAFFYHDRDEASSSAISHDQLRDNLNFLYSLDLGPLTAGVSYGYGSHDIEIFNSTSNLSVHTFGAGLRMDLSSSAYLDLAGEIRDINEDRHWDPNFQGTSPNNFYSYRGRAFVALGQRMALVPLVEIIHEDRQQPYFSTAVHNNSLQRYGIGLNYFPDTDHLLLFNAEYVDGGRAFRTSGNTTLTDDWTALILKAGFESRMLSWLTTRGSLGFVDYKLVTELNSEITYPSESNLEDPILSINLGASIHLGPADLDLSFSDRFPEARFMARDLIERQHWLSMTARFLF